MTAFYTNRSIKIATFNCRGLRDNNKRSRIFQLCEVYGCDVLFLQETHISSKAESNRIEGEWGGKCLWSFGSSQSRGVGILFNKHLNVVIESVVYDTDGRYVIVDVAIDTVKWRLINIYCPNHATSRVQFLDSLAVWLDTSRLLIVGGDFNFVDNLTLDKVGGNPQEGNEGAETWQRIRQCGTLSDPFRRFHKNNVVTTWSSGNKSVACRLDRFYVCSRVQDKVTSIDVWPCGESDHCFVCMSLLPDSNNAVGPGYWKCNVQTLEDPHFIEDFCALWERLSREPIKNLNWWEYCKAQFKRLIINHSCRLAGNRNSELRDLNSRLRELSQNSSPINSDEEIDGIKDKIKELLDQKIAGAKVRSKINFIENEEKPTRVFLQKAKSRASKAHIAELNIGGTKITETSDLINTCGEFYKKLYTAETIESHIVEHFLEGLPTLTPEQATQCEGPLTVKECVTALKAMKSMKTPGSDGLPKEFYEKFFYLFGEDFVKVMNDACDCGLMSPSQRLGYITLLCKDSQHADNLSNWRPVSLLNVDYKIVSKSLANRLRKVLGLVVNFDQTCSVPGRSITDNIHLLRNVCDYCTHGNVPCVIVSYDQAKAFDRVSHDYLFRVLHAFGFKDSFIKWIKLLYNDISSCVLVNGFLSEEFSVQRSVRQGCGLSPLLYVLCIEPLANKIRESTDIQGVRLPGTSRQTRISLYADDTTTISVDVFSVLNAIKIFEQFTGASGASLNRNKCAALIVSGNMNTADLPPWLPVKESIKICGVHFGQNMDILNENMLMPKISTAVRLHMPRALTLRGKVTVINTVICAKLWYVGACVLFSKEFISRVNRLIFKFIWKNEWVSRNTLVLPPTDGGLGVYSLDLRLAAFRCDHLRRLFQDSEAKWKHFAVYWIGHSVRMWAPALASNILAHSEWRPKFYLRALVDFRQVHSGPTAVDPSSVTVKFAYKRLLSKVASLPRCVTVEPLIDFKSTWQALNCYSLDPRARDVMWRLAHGVLPVRARLHKFHMTNCLICPLCGLSQMWETSEHLFLQCSVVQPIWNHLTPHFSQLAKGHIPLSKAVVFYLNIPTSCGGQAASVAYLISEVVYCVWIKRNAAVFERRKCSSADIKSFLSHRINFRRKVDLIRLTSEQFEAKWESMTSVAHSL